MRERKFLQKLHRQILSGNPPSATHNPMWNPLFNSSHPRHTDTITRPGMDAHHESRRPGCCTTPGRQAAAPPEEHTPQKRIKALQRMYKPKPDGNTAPHPYVQPRQKDTATTAKYLPIPLNCYTFLIRKHPKTPKNGLKLAVCCIKKLIRYICRLIS